MLSILLILKKIIKFLNSNESIENIALSLTISISLAIIPFNIIIFLMLLCLLIIMNGNIMIFLLVYPVLNLFSYKLYPFLHEIGDLLLRSQNLLSLWEIINNIPIMIFLKWNNTVQLGSYILIIISGYPAYILIKKIVKAIREKIIPKLEKTKLRKIFKVPNWIMILFKE